MTELIQTLFAWAIILSGYPAPDYTPMIAFRPHSFFVARACGGVECNVLGWYNDQSVVYIDEKFMYKLDGNAASSIVVHEFVHYLQDKSGKFDPYSCEDSAKREREAYAIQNRYITEVLYSFKFVPSHPITCKE